MTRDLEKARAAFADSEYTCVVCKGETVLTSAQRGVKPLLAWLDSGECPGGFSAADRVVGKAAAFLYVLLGAQAVYAQVMSVPAKSVLTENGIEALCDTLADAIRSRDGKGFCPMETAVWDINDPEQALAAIKETAARMRAGQANTPAPDAKE